MKKMLSNSKKTFEIIKGALRHLENKDEEE